MRNRRARERRDDGQEGGGSGEARERTLSSGGCARNRGDGNSDGAVAIASERAHIGRMGSHSKKLTVLLTASVLALASCGGDDETAAPPAPAPQENAAAGGAPAGVSGKSAASPAKLCAAHPKKKAQGAKGKSPFAQCVSAMKKAAAGESPARACRGLSRKKTKGVRGGTPFSLCVRSAKKAAAAEERSAGSGDQDEAGDVDDEDGDLPAREDDTSEPAGGAADDDTDADDDRGGRGRGKDGDDVDVDPPADEPDADDVP